MNDDTAPGLIYSAILIIIIAVTAFITSMVHYGNLHNDCQKLNKTIIREKVYECKEIK